MKDYILKFKALKNSLVAAWYKMSDERIIEYVLSSLGSEFNQNFQNYLWAKRYYTYVRTFAQLCELLQKEDLIIKNVDSDRNKPNESEFRVNYSNYNKNNKNRYFQNKGKLTGGSNKSDSEFKSNNFNSKVDVLIILCPLPKNDLIIKIELLYKLYIKP